jgi:hypothetical protein
MDVVGVARRRSAVGVDCSKGAGVIEMARSWLQAASNIAITPMHMRMDRDIANLPGHKITDF